MMKKLQELICKDFGWKLLSIAIATILWFMVINIDQPIGTRDYSRPLSVRNIEVLTDRGLTVGNLEELKNTKIVVKVKAQRTALDRLSQNPEWITASVDLSELSYAVNGDVIALPVTVSVQGGNTYGISSKSPAVVEVSVETMASKELPVEVDLNGDLEDGTYLSEPLLSTETVLVVGPSSLVNNVTSVRAAVAAEDIEQSPDIMAPLTCYNAAGMIVKGVFTDPEEIMVSYALHDMKQVPLQVEITGTPAPGYQVGNIYCRPQYAALLGSPEALERIASLQLDSINVSGMTTSTSRTFHLADYLPEGITLMKDANETAEVTVEIFEQSQKQLTLSSSDLKIMGQENGKEYILHGDAHITLSGDGPALESIQADDLQGSINVNGLSAGDHKVMIHASLPDGFLMNPSYITVTVKETEASE
ncbi:CdaR family protein [Anaerotignum sp.]